VRGSEALVNERCRDHLAMRMFISYRRNDSADQAGRVFDRLVTAFRRDRVFKDVDSVPAGADFRKVIEEAVRRAEIVVLIIGPSWLSSADESGRRRLDDKNDFVRLELEYALRFGKVIIPVLVRGGAMPRAAELPETLREVAFRHAVSVRPDPDFHRDMDRLIQAIKSRKSEPRRTIPAILTRTPVGAPHALATIGLLIVTIVVGQLFSGSKKQGPDPPVRKAEIELPRNVATPSAPAPRTTLPYPAAPSKTMPGDFVSTSPAPPVIKTARSGPTRPSPQAPAYVPPLEEAPPAPPAPAPGSGALGTTEHGEQCVATAEPDSVGGTTGRPNSQWSEDVPPPHLINISTYKHSS
jgi:hypothetical protein